MNASTNPSLDKPGRWSQRILQLEDLILALLLGSMILLACTQILLRNGFDSGLTWADPLLRVMVLWIGLLGAMAASRGNRHIVIDVLGPFLGAANKRRAAILSHSFTALVCAALVWFSCQFVYSEYETGLTGALNIPIWLLESIIPFSFAVMGLRYAAMTLEALRAIPGTESDPGSSA